MIPNFEHIQLITDVSMATLSTYRIGGKVAFLAKIDGDASELNKLLNWAQQQQLLWAVIGNGSNILMPDNDLQALLIKLADNPDQIIIKDCEISVGAGINNSDLALATAKAGLAGFGFLYDIPGTIGGAIMQNAGMNEEDFSQLVKDVTHIAPDGTVFHTSVQELDFGYRHSIFKGPFKNHIIIGATLLAKGRADPTELITGMKKIKELRWSKFPMEYGNCGSVFKRPTGYYAGKLIQDAGLSGYTIGGAQVSQKHRNFLVNLGNATSMDVKNLIVHVQNSVWQQTGVKLERELIFLEEILQRV